MVKFSKQMELQLVPEWRHKFCNYWQLKKEIKRMKLQKAPSNPSEQHHRQQGEVPAGKRPDAGASWTPLSTFTRRSMHPWAYEDIIKVHERKGDSQEDGHYGYLYETEIVEGVSINDLEKEFFKCLDQELNKVNRFFFAKEQEFLERAEILSRQLTSLSEIHQAYNNTVAQFDRPAQLDSKANDAVPSDAFTPTKSRILHSLFNRLSKFKELLYSRALPYSAYTDSNSGRYKRDETDTEENSRHPLNPHATDEDQSTKPECTMITVGSLDGEEEKIRNEKKSKVCEVNAKTSDLYDDEDWTLDRLFNQIHTSVKHEDINSTPSGGISISNLIRMLSQRLPWETSRRHQQAAGNKEQHLKEEEREEGSLADNYDTCMNDSCHKKTENGAAQSVRLGASYGSLATQRSFGDGMASLRKIITARGEEHLRLDENCVSLSKIKHARKMLRTAFVEFYRGLGLLRTFSSLNVLAFAKILKKYDKVTGRQVSPTYMKIVENAYFSTSDKVVKMMDNVEKVFTEQFAKDDEKKAMLLLRPVQNEAPHTITFFLGLFTGSSAALLLAFAITLQTFKLRALRQNELAYSETAYQVFGMLFLVLLHMYLYGWNVYVWRKARINYAFIFEYAPKTELRHREILLVCTGLTCLVAGGMLVHLLAYASTRMQMNPDIIPLATIVALLLLLLCPFDVCYRSSRVFFIKCMKRITFAPFYKVLLADFFLADQLTSQVTALRSLQFVMCYYFGGYFQRHNTTACGSSEFRFLAYLISFLPYWWRLMQCLRRRIEEGDQAQLANGCKYLSAMVAAAARISYSFYPSSYWLVLFVITSSFATLYQMYWDVVRDWGFFQPHSRNPWLRDQLILKNKSIYYFSIALNFILRFAWLQQVIHWQIRRIEHSGTDLFFAALEVIRRGHWNFYRLENEHLNNVGKHRAVKLVPLPFGDEYKSHV